jgi:hypothetical protein
MDPAGGETGCGTPLGGVAAGAVPGGGNVRPAPGWMAAAPVGGAGTVVRPKNGSSAAGRERHPPSGSSASSNKTDDVNRTGRNPFRTRLAEGSSKIGRRHARQSPHAPHNGRKDSEFTPAVKVDSPSADDGPAPAGGMPNVT